MPQCKYCPTEIEFIQTKTGSRVPVEGDHIAYNDLQPGETILTDGGHTYRKKADKSYPNVKGRFVHFATCPGADRARRPR